MSKTSGIQSQEYTTSFVATNTASSPVQEMWNQFKTMCSNCLELVLHKLSSIRFNQPWVTSNTKRICRKKKVLGQHETGIITITLRNLHNTNVILLTIIMCQT